MGAIYDSYIKSKAKQSLLFINNAPAPDFDSYKPGNVTVPVAAPKAASASKGKIYDSFLESKKNSQGVFAPTVSAPVAEPQKTGFLQKAKGIVDAYKQQVERKSMTVFAGALGSIGGLVRSVELFGNMLLQKLPQPFDGNVRGEKKITQGTISDTNIGKRFQDWTQQGAEAVKQSAGITPENQTFVEKATEGLGSSLPYFVPGVGLTRAATALRASPKLAMLFGNVSSSALESMAEAGQVFDEVSKTKGEAEGKIAAMRTFLANAVVLTVTERLGIFNPNVNGMLKRALVSMPAEGVQESLQQMIQNNETGRPMWEGVLESGAIGAVVGGVLGPSVDVVRLSKEISMREEAQSTKPQTPQQAASLYWDNVIQKDIEQGKGITIGADNMKDFFGKDYDDSRHSVYSKASYQEIFPRALSVDTHKNVILVGGGPASAKTEGIINKMRAEGFQGIIYDSNASNKDGVFKLIDDIRAAGKNPVLVGIIPKVERSAGFAFTRERKVNEDSFVVGHTGFPNVARAALQEGKLTPENVRLLDTRNLTEIRDIQKGIFASDPVALLDEVRYDENYVRQTYRDAEQRARLPRPIEPRPRLDTDNQEGLPGRGSSSGRLDTDAGVSRVFKRLQAEQPEVLKGELSYQKINLQEQAERAVDLIQKDKQQAFRVAMGVEESTDVTSTAVNVALSERALEEGNLNLYTRLVKNRSLAQTRRGQEIVSERGSVSDNSTSRFVKQLIAVRLANAGKMYLSNLRTKMTDRQKGMEVLDKEVKKAKDKLGRKEMDLAAAQKLIDSLAC